MHTSDACPEGVPRPWGALPGGRGSGSRRAGARQALGWGTASCGPGSRVSSGGYGNPIPEVETPASPLPSTPAREGIRPQYFRFGCEGRRRRAQEGCVFNKGDARGVETPFLILEKGARGGG